MHFTSLFLMTERELSFSASWLTALVPVNKSHQGRHKQ